MIQRSRNKSGHKDKDVTVREGRAGEAYALVPKGLPLTKYQNMEGLNHSSGS